MAYYFRPYVIQGSTGERMDVQIEPATQAQLDLTHARPHWQTDWASDYLSDPTIDKYAVTAEGGELIALGAYQIRGRNTYVYIIYLESAPHSNPTMRPRADRKYWGIGELLIAFGIKYCLDNNGFGDVVFEAKTDELARHYEKDFHAKPVMGSASGARRYMLADADALSLFSRFLEEAKT